MGLTGLLMACYEGKLYEIIQVEAQGSFFSKGFPMGTWYGPFDSGGVCSMGP